MGKIVKTWPSLVKIGQVAAGICVPAWKPLGQVLRFQRQCGVSKALTQRWLEQAMKYNIIFPTIWFTVDLSFIVPVNYLILPENYPISYHLQINKGSLHQPSVRYGLFMPRPLLTLTSKLPIYRTFGV